MVIAMADSQTDFKMTHHSVYMDILAVQGVKVNMGSRGSRGRGASQLNQCKIKQNSEC